MVGIDTTFFNVWDASLQLIDRFVPDASEELIRVQGNRLYAAARVSRKYRNGTWETEFNVEKLRAVRGDKHDVLKLL
jgi:hypothetical protein